MKTYANALARVLMLRLMLRRGSCGAGSGGLGTGGRGLGTGGGGLGTSRRGFGTGGGRCRGPGGGRSGPPGGRSSRASRRRFRTTPTAAAWWGRGWANRTRIDGGRYRRHRDTAQTRRVEYLLRGRRACGTPRDFDLAVLVGLLPGVLFGIFLRKFQNVDPAAPHSDQDSASHHTSVHLKMHILCEFCVSFV